MNKMNTKVSHFYFIVDSIKLRDDDGVTLLYKVIGSDYINAYHFKYNETFPSGVSFENFKPGAIYVVTYQVKNGKIHYLKADRVSILDSIE
jgi:hypothetical protein